MRRHGGGGSGSDLGVPDEGGGARDEDPLSGDAARVLVQSLRGSAESLRARPWREIVEVLGRVGERFLDPADPLRRRAEELIPDDAGVSAPMARSVVEGMARDWTGERLEALVRADFPDPGVLDGFRPGPGGSRVRALGPALTLHVGAGSVPGVTATSMVRSLLVKSPALVKPGEGDRVLPRLFARGIGEEDEALARSMAVVYWPGGEGEAVEEEALSLAEQVVVYGGNEAVRSLRRRLPPWVPLVAYHHRVSVGMVGRERLGAGGPSRSLAESAARAVALFDQRGCVSPHVIWVEEGGETGPADWAGLLADALEGLEGELPSGPPSPETASEVQQLRGAVEMRGAAGGADRVFGGRSGSWTVVFEEDPGFVPSCLGRTVRVKPVGSLEEVPRLLAPFGEVLQTAAVERKEEGRPGLAEALARVGVTRITTFPDQPWPPPWWRHDGRGPLDVLVRWVSLEG